MPARPLGSLEARERGGGRDRRPKGSGCVTRRLNIARGARAARTGHALGAEPVEDLLKPLLRLRSRRRRSGWRGAPLRKEGRERGRRCRARPAGQMGDASRTCVARRVFRTVVSIAGGVKRSSLLGFVREKRSPSGRTCSRVLLLSRGVVCLSMTLCEKFKRRVDATKFEAIFVDMTVVTFHDMTADDPQQTNKRSHGCLRKSQHPRHA